jgi:hypothetical protein
MIQSGVALRFAAALQIGFSSLLDPRRCRKQPQQQPGEQVHDRDRYP